ncbi:GDSL-type esterase/lipase family protein [Frankia sp. CiP3]|uniref:GDSL-type esterase/lipase family protein n=1 Tax=Frankia sp. CiP3 TaxID=2880971 RepID=UPI001EF6F0C7|nr:GDSL-type esterase/lipase family protein [Frankia sp. CiP3]
MATANGICFVALGDSITAGLGDGVSMGRYRRAQAERALAGRGWAATLAACLAPAGQVRFANLAATGATTRDVRGSQIPVALAMRPQIVSLIAGMNDVLSPGFDPLCLRHNLVWSVRDLRAAGSWVLMARLHDPGRLLRLPGPARRLLTTRVGHLNAAVDAAAAADPGVLVVDLARHPDVYQLATFDVDRVHPGPRGHQLIARAFAEALHEAGASPVVLPTVGAPPVAPTRLAHAHWLALVGLPWLLARPASPMRRQLHRIRAAREKSSPGRMYGYGVMPATTGSLPTVERM